MPPVAGGYVEHTTPFLVHEIKISDQDCVIKLDKMLAVARLQARMAHAGTFPPRFASCTSFILDLITAVATEQGHNETTVSVAMSMARQSPSSSPLINFSITKQKDAALKWCSHQNALLFHHVGINVYLNPSRCLRACFCRTVQQSFCSLCVNVLLKLQSSLAMSLLSFFL